MVQSEHDMACSGTCVKHVVLNCCTNDEGEVVTLWGGAHTQEVDHRGVYKGMWHSLPFLSLLLSAHKVKILLCTVLWS